MPIAHPHERIGSRIGDRYQLLEIIGEGGMAIIYGGRHSITGRDVAVKLLHDRYSADREVVERFMDEARSAAALQHPNVVSVLDMGWDPSERLVFLVLERLRGETLKERLSRGPLTLNESAELLLPIMDALSKAHASGVVHRDLKPSNIFLDHQSGQIVPKLLDFGIAKLLREASPSLSRRRKRTATGVALGTPAYMSPEQARGESSLGAATDVWSMGVILFQCIAGCRPFRGTGAISVTADILSRPAPLLTEVVPEASPALTQLLRFALSPNPEARPTMEELAEGLKSIAANEAAVARLDGSSELTGIFASPLEPEPLGVATQSAWSHPDDGTGERSFRRQALTLPLTVALIAVVSFGTTFLLIDHTEASSPAPTATASEDTDAGLPLSPTGREPGEPDAGSFEIDADAGPIDADGGPIESERRTTQRSTRAHPLAPTATPWERAIACVERGDSECAVRALQGRARTTQERALLIESLRNLGRRSEAEAQMRELILHHPDSPRARQYQRQLSAR